MRNLWAAVLAVIALGATTPNVDAAVQITEWMYNPVAATNGEYVEITNRGAAPVDLTGWSFDDSSNTPGAFSLSALGILAPGESAIITEPTAAAFRTEWNLAAAVKVIGGNNQNLGRADEINIYDAANVRIDWLTYDDQGTGDVDGPRTQGVSGNPMTLAALGAHKAVQWQLAVAGDAYGSYNSVGNDIGNPGVFLLVPEPSAGVLAAVGLCMRRLRRRTRS
jgi:predicted extracellular nuclease